MKEEIEKKLKELREKRDELNIKSSEIQLEIDKLEMEKHEIPNLIGKYIKTKNQYSEEIYGKVKEVKRLTYGIKIILENALILDIDKKSFTFINFEYTFMIRWEDITNDMIIFECEYNAAIRESVNIIVGKQE